MSITHKILNAEEMDRIMTRMSHEILERHKGTDRLALVGIHTRGVHIAGRIRSKIRETEQVQVPFGVIDITLYRDDWTRITRHPVVRNSDISFSVDETHIILVDDVLFTGRTVRSAMDAIIDFGRPDSIMLAVMVDRGHRELPIQADFIGKYVETRQTETVNVMLKESDGVDQVVIIKEDSAV